MKLTLAPGLVGATTLAGRRWGPRVAGWLGGLPVVVGPILLAFALERGSGFASRAAAGALLGLLSLNAFVLAYAWGARLVGWFWAVVLGWAAFGVATFLLDGVSVPAGVGLVVVLASFFLTSAALPRGVAGVPVAAPQFDLVLRMSATAGLVLVLTAVAGVLGPRLSGLLAAFPVLATVLAAFTHAQDGPAAVAQFLRGLVTGLTAFAVFCFVAAVSLGADWGVAPAFLTASAAALLSHALTLLLRRARPARAEAASAGGERA